MRYLICIRPKGHHVFRIIDKNLERTLSVEKAKVFSYEETVETLKIIRSKGIDAKVRKENGTAYWPDPRPEFKEEITIDKELPCPKQHLNLPYPKNKKSLTL